MPRDYSASRREGMRRMAGAREACQAGKLILLAGPHQGLHGAAMSVLKTAADRRSTAFRENESAMRAIVEDLRRRVAEIRKGGGEEARQKHLARGKLLPR